MSAADVAGWTFLAWWAAVWWMLATALADAARDGTRIPYLTAAWDHVSTPIRWALTRASRRT